MGHTDAERMRWMQKNLWFVDHSGDGTWSVRRRTKIGFWEATTLARAIDRAMDNPGKPDWSDPSEQA
ncbi:MAG: hypothetical protein HY323_07085 [Betaproteobacteria bacterium]|nr:hypothetical protein [Betaproteobacteria bacterium]